MKLDGRRNLIAGSADVQTPETDLLYAHKLIRELAHDLVVKGASFVTSFGKEPYLEGREDGPSIIFDWTVAESVHSALAYGQAQSSGPSGKLIATIATEKTFAQIPQHRQDLYDALRGEKAVSMEFLEPGWGSGAMRRQRQAQLADILIAISGGEGVEHLAVPAISSISRSYQLKDLSSAMEQGRSGPQSRQCSCGLASRRFGVLRYH
jgi:hypothetical protein